MLTAEQKFRTDTFLFLTILRLTVAYVSEAPTGVGAIQIAAQYVPYKGLE